jgi:hypothetical protein
MGLLQLDFLGNYINNENQLELFNHALEPNRKARNPNYRTVEEFFNGLSKEKIDRYCEYWEGVKPKTVSDTFRRWLFAFMSVHTSWKANVAGYNAIKNWWEWLGDDEALLKAIDDSRVGMQNNRLRYISTFAKTFWGDGAFYKKGENETWSEYRNRLEKKTLGLGPAKTSFSLEMCFPNEAYVACLDTHLFQVYGLDQSKDLRRYEEIEAHWLDMSRMWNVPPYIARCIYWDQKQNKEDSRYWSYVLE